MSEGHAKNAIPGALKSRSPKVTRDNFKFHVISSVGNVFSNTSSHGEKDRPTNSKQYRYQLLCERNLFPLASQNRGFLNPLSIFCHSSKKRTVFCSGTMTIVLHAPHIHWRSRTVSDLSPPSERVMGTVDS